jgi:hypothetical protein
MRRRRSVLRRHSLSLTLAVFVVFFLMAYSRADPATRWGAFFGNSIADWLGSLVIVVATKFWFETGSAESRVMPKLHRHVPDWLEGHSLTIVVLVTWVGWIWWFAHIDPNGKTGQVVGNIVSEWGQMLSLIWFTKFLYERGSKESRR